MTVLYFARLDGELLTGTKNSLLAALCTAGHSLICPFVKEEKVIRRITPEEVEALELSEPFEKLAEPDKEGYVVVRYDDSPLAHPMDCVKWPTGRYGQNTEQGFPFKVHLNYLFPQLK